jgi:hypothetical protein
MCAAAALVAAGSARAQTAAGAPGATGAPGGGAASPRPEPRFDIKRFEVAGADKVPADRLAAALAPFTGPGRRFSDIESAVQAVRDVYAEASITAVQVLIPEQTLEGGVVKLEVEELKVARIEISGAQARSRENVLRAVPGLSQGITPVDTELSAELRLANENPGRQMQVTFRTEDDGSLTGVLRVADRSPLPLLLYNIPMVTGGELPEEVVVRLCRHPRIVEEQLGRVLGLLPDLVEHPATAEALNLVGLHDDQRDTLRALRRVRLRDHQDEVGRAAIRDEDLRAVDDIVVAVPAGRCAHRLKV